jgi:hypothetical protein
VIENPGKAGQCNNCYEDKTVFNPPLLDFGVDVDELENDGSTVWFHNPKKTYYRGKDGYCVHYEDDKAYLVPWEAADEQLCFECWAGSVVPEDESFIANQPKQFKLNGWQHPIWLEEVPA